MTDRYFSTEERIREYERGEPINARYNLDMLSMHGIRPADFKGKAVLDAGCGFGLLLKSFHDAGARCFGTDISELAISRCRERFPSIRTEVSDCSGNPFKEKFALIMCFGTLGLVGKDRHIDFLRMASQSLCDGGTIFANAPNVQRPGFMDALAGKKRSSSYNNARAAAEWKALLAQAGFKDYAVYPVLRVPKSERFAGKNIFLRPGFGDPLVIFARR